MYKSAGLRSHACVNDRHRALTQMGTEKESFVDLTERIGRKTGGVSASAFVSNVKGRDDPVAFVILRGKAMGDKAGDMLAIMTDVLQGAKLDNQERFKQVRQYVAEVF